MKVLVVYDSFFGNTEQVARAIGDALTAKEVDSRESVSVLRVGGVTPTQLGDLDVLVVGSPTRAFRPSRDITTFLKRIPARSLKGVKIAAFDTRMSPADVGSRVYSFLAKHFGYAAEPIAGRLQNNGGEPAVEPEGFFVLGTEGPLREGELDRAAGWARKIIGAR